MKPSYSSFLLLYVTSFSPLPLGPLPSFLSAADIEGMFRVNYSRISVPLLEGGLPLPLTRRCTPYGGIKPTPSQVPACPCR